MKMFKAILILILGLTFTQLSFSQDATFDLNRKIELRSETSTVQNIKINVTENTIHVRLSIECQVGGGNLTIEILDPNGVKKGDFSIESQLKKDEQKKGSNQSTEMIEGQINQSLNTPINGDWIVKIIPKKAYAIINVKTKHSINY